VDRTPGRIEAPNQAEEIRNFGAILRIGVELKPMDGRCCRPSCCHPPTRWSSGWRRFREPALVGGPINRRPIDGPCYLLVW